MLAAIRPDSWNYALFLHVLGAMILVGALVTAGTAQVPPEAVGRIRFGGIRPAGIPHASLRGVPAWFAMRIGAEWIY